MLKKVQKCLKVFIYHCLSLFITFFHFFYCCHDYSPKQMFRRKNPFFSVLAGLPVHPPRPIKSCNFNDYRIFHFYTRFFSACKNNSTSTIFMPICCSRQFKIIQCYQGKNQYYISFCTTTSK